MPVRICLINLLAIMLGAATLFACTAPDSPAPIAVDENSEEAGTTATLLPELATATATQTRTASPSPSLTSTPSPTSTGTPTPTEMPFNVTGQVCFPGETIPPMTAYFEDTGAGTVVELPIAENQDVYEVKLPPGSYIAYAWLGDYSQGGLYSRAVSCGLNEDCDDHGDG